MHFGKKIVIYFDYGIRRFKLRSTAFESAHVGFLWLETGRFAKGLGEIKPYMTGRGVIVA